jgi:hypothetical protein
LGRPRPADLIFIPPDYALASNLTLKTLVGDQPKACDAAIVGTLTVNLPPIL